MIKYLLDTDFCVHAIRKRTPAVTKVVSSSASEMAISDISIYELYYGAENYAVPETRFAVVEDFRKRFPVLPFDTKAARHAGAIRASLQRNGNMIGNLDILIAATALSHNLTLLTGNTREFSRIDGLRIETWR